MIRNMRGMIVAGPEMCDRVQAGRLHKFARPQRRPPEPCASLPSPDRSSLDSSTVSKRRAKLRMQGVIRVVRPDSRVGYWP
jgi:hypothetical protein